MIRPARPLAELAQAVALLTRLPVPASLLRDGRGAGAADCVWAYPLAGLLVGLVAATAFHVGLPPLPASALAITLATLATGGLHEDGLADTADGLGGATPARRLEILKDPRLGAHGGTALVLAALLRVSALASLPEPAAQHALVAASVLSRTAILPVLALAQPARGQGLAAGLGAVRRGRLAGGIALGVACFAVAAPDHGRVLALAGAAVASVIVARIAAARFGGYTGDLLGAAAVVSECAVLLLVVV